MNDDRYLTSYSSVTLILLKELRLELNYHQAQLAEMCDKSHNTWTKIETGRSTLSMESFFRVCNGMKVNPSILLAAVERYVQLLFENKIYCPNEREWLVLSKQIDFNGENEEDSLLSFAQAYYSSPGYRMRVKPLPTGISFVLNGPYSPFDRCLKPLDVFRFALDSKFRNSQLHVDTHSNQKSNSNHTYPYGGF